MNLSVVIITRNESRNIRDCIESVAFAAEIVVLDHSSEDDTVNIARAMGAKVEVASDWPGFGIQKNRAIAMATGDWILCLDADERITPTLAQEILQALQDHESDLFEIPRLTNFCGQWIRHCGWRPDYVVRLFKRGQARYTDDLVHERLIPAKNAAIGRMKQDMLHYSYPTPSHYWRKLQVYSDAWAQQRWKDGKRTSLTRAFLSGVFAFVRSYFFRLGFMDRGMGLVVCTMQAQSAFAKYFTLYCLNQADVIRQKNK